MKIPFCTRNLLLLHVAMLFSVVRAMQSESNEISTVQLRYAKPLLVYTILCSWWPTHTYAITQIDIHSDDVSRIADDATDTVHRVPSIDMHLSVSPSLSPQHFAILELRNRINRQLKSMNENELLVPTIQKLFDSNEPMPLSVSQNDTKMLGQMVIKMEAKLSKAIATVDETSAKIMDIIASAESKDTKSQSHQNAHERISLETIVLPCSTDARGVDVETVADERSRLTLDDNKSIEILNYLSHAAGHLHETSDKNFTTNSRILDEIKSIQTTATSGMNSISFRDIFFLAKDNYASVSNCRRYFPNEEYRRLLISHLKSKRLMMIVDNGASVSNEEHFDVAKTLGEHKKCMKSKRSCVSATNFLVFFFMLSQPKISSIC